MAFDEGLAERVREALADEPLLERRMFSGLVFLLDGNMVCGVLGDDLLVRVGIEHYHAALAEPDARPFDATGKPMRGWVLVGPDGCAEDDQLAAWLRRGLRFARSLPPKF